MSVEVSKNETSLIIPKISQEIFNHLNTGIFVFNVDKYAKEINQVGLNIISTVYPEINSLELAKELTLNKIFNETNFPGWFSKFESVNNDSCEWLNEYLNASLSCGNRIYAVKAGKISSKSEENLFFVTLEDVTDKKNSEERLAWLEKNTEKGSMASIIVHDLNNYLSLLLGGAELAEMMLGNGKTEKAVEKIEKLKVNVGKMEKFIAAFTDDYKIETNNQKANLNSLIKNVVLYVSTRKRFAEISIISQLDSKIPEFEFDVDQLSRLLLNFLNNSAEAIGELEKKQGQIIINTELSDTNILMTISDNGTGLNKDVKMKLFKRRFTTKENHTGYGLMDCSYIVGNHNGQVEIVDNANEGAAFKITLPIG